MHLAPMRRRPSRPPMPSLLLPLVTLLITLLAGGCATPGSKPAPMVCPSTPPGCAKEDVPWYRQDVTEMIPPPPVEPRMPPEQIAAGTTNDGNTEPTVDSSQPPEATASASGPVVSSFAVTREKEPTHEAATAADPPPANVASAPEDRPPPTSAPLPTTPPAAPIERTEHVAHLPSDDLFGLGSAVLGPAGRQSLDALADRLHGTAYTHIHVIAHTDRTGQPMTNLKLSWQRARNVRDHLATRGIPGNVLDHEGRGSRDARIDPDRCGRVKAARIRCLAPDRRVDIVVTQRRAP